MEAKIVEPAEKAARTAVKVVLMVFALAVSIVLGEFYRGLGWTGLVIFVVGPPWEHLLFSSGKLYDADGC
ncbi:MAG TPA: hypothetical protein VLW84_12455 [Terriglobales bacterium]|nr:hypothetical protein [Terriglobales bacterium]